MLRSKPDPDEGMGLIDAFLTLSTAGKYELWFQNLTVVGRTQEKIVVNVSESKCDDMMLIHTVVKHVE